MAAIEPPNNQAGIPAPLNPVRPSTLRDISNSRSYLQKLDYSKSEFRSQVHAHYVPLISIPELELPNSATDEEIGSAAVYDLRLLVDHIPVPAEPPWLANLNNTIQAIANDMGQMRAEVAQIRTDLTALVATVNTLTADVAILTANTGTSTNNITTLTANLATVTNDVALLRQRSDEQPIILANSRAGNKERLYNPLALLPNNWAAPLGPPNPINRDELLHFSGEKLTCYPQNV